MKKIKEDFDNKPKDKDFKISKCKSNTLVFKMNLKRKENKKREKENKKSNKLWPLSLILLLRIKKNKLDLKIKKCLDTFKISSKNKNKTKNAGLENNKNRKNK